MRRYRTITRDFAFAGIGSCRAAGEADRFDVLLVDAEGRLTYKGLIA